MPLPCIGVPKELWPNERRCAATPDSVQRLKKLGYASVLIERGAGAAAGFSDDSFTQVGASIVDTNTLYKDAAVLLKVRAPDLTEVKRMRAGQLVVSFMYPAQNPELLDALSTQGVTALAMDCVPRITRAQKMDALSSMANVAGYRAIIEAANVFGRLFSGQITAAGKISPAKVLVIGAGVAGLSAAGTAKGMGAIVRAFDTRPAAREQVQSMGAEFLEVTGVHEDGTGTGGYAKEMSQAFIDAEMALFRAQAKDVDIIITTALIPGKPAPKLVLADMVDSMRPGSVIVDLAAEQGGNCAYTKAGEVVTTSNGVSVVGYTDLPSRMAAQTSQLYGTNLCHLLDDMSANKAGDRNFRVDFDDEVVRAATVTKDHAITWPPPKKAAAAPPAPTAAAITSAATVTAITVKHAAAPTKAKAHASHAPSGLPNTAALVIAGVVLLGMGVWAPPAFLAHLIVFMLACFVGYQVVWSVSPALHTPLMSVTNAISGIILVGGLLHASDGLSRLPASTVLGALAILLATINIAGGFLVTQRMLKMFRRGES